MMFFYQIKIDIIAIFKESCDWKDIRQKILKQSYC